MIRRTERNRAHAWPVKAAAYLAACAICLLAAAPAAHAQTILSISRATTDVGTTTTLMLALENAAEEFAGIHVEFNVPGNITFNGGSAGPGLAGFTSAAYNFTKDGVNCGGFVAYSATRAAIPGEVLATLTFAVGAGAATGPVAVPITFSRLSNAAGTATPAHTATGGAIMVTAGSGGSIAEIAQMLFNEFQNGDANNDDRLSFDEARMLRDTLSQAQFDAIDTNGDGFLTMEELIAAGADPGGPDTPSCCPAQKTPSLSELRHRLGDFVLLGLALGILAGMGAYGRRRD